MQLTKRLFKRLGMIMNRVASSVSPHLMASALRWWQESGVDVISGDVPVSWLTSSAPPPRANTAADARPAPPPLPATLADLHNWLADDKNLAFAGPAKLRYPAFGQAGAELMVLTDMPEIEDAKSGALLTGPAGELFDKMLSALKLDRSQIYGAALCPARPAGGRLPDDAIEELRRIGLHHIALAAPKRLWLLGQSTGRTIFGADSAANGSHLQTLNHSGVKVTAITSLHPRVLLQQPKRKAQVWAEMQLLMGEVAA